MTKIVADGGGLRFNAGKPPHELLPPEAMEALAHHYGQGARKYAPRNWERGMAWGVVFGCLLRHAWAFWRGRRYDPDTGSHHMIAVMWNAAALFTYDVREIGEDDRPKAAVARPLWVVAEPDQDQVKGG